MRSPMGSITMRMPAELLAAVDAAALERHATRSALVRALIEDAIDAGELPIVSAPAFSTSELLTQLRDDEFERLLDLTVDPKEAR